MSHEPHKFVASGISPRVTKCVEKRFGYSIGLSCPTPQTVSSHSTNTTLIYNSDVLTKIQSKGQEFSPDVIELNQENPVRTCNNPIPMPSSSKPAVEQTHIIIKRSTKLVPDKTLCGNCGVTSLHPTVCTSCKKSIRKTDNKSKLSSAKSQAATNHNHTAPDHTSQNSGAMETGNFYGNEGLSEFKQYLQPRKKNLRISRKNKDFKKPSECITISDSSDDDDPRPEIFSCSEGAEFSSSEKAHCERSAKEFQPKVPRLEIRNSDRCRRKPISILHVEVESVQIGERKAVPTTSLQISNVEISMSLSDAIFRLKWFMVKRIEMSPVIVHPCLYVTVTDDCLGEFRSSLGMVPGKSPYYDPHGSERQRYIVFHLDTCWFSKLETSLRKTLRDLCTTLKRGKDFFEEIVVSEANRRQRSINCDEKIDKKLPLTTSVGSSSTSPSVLTSINRSYRLRGRSKPPQPPLQPLSEITEVRSVFVGPRVQLAIYPPPPSTGGISITTEDLFCLNEGEFLNDVIVDFYLKYTMEELISEEDKLRSHVFSCFFFKRLTQGVKGGNQAQDNKHLSAAERRHSRVRKWTRNVDLFSKDFIFIPINDASHWYLAVICFPGKEFLKCEPSDTLDLVVTDVRSLNGSSSEIFKPHENATEQEEDQLPPLVIENVGQSVDTAPEFDLETGSNQSNQDLSAQSPAGNANGISSDVEMRELSPDPLEIEVIPQQNIASNDVIQDTPSVCEQFCAISHENNNVQNGFNRYPCILIFDSIRSVSRSKTATFLREYLNEEWRYRKSSQLGERVFNPSNMKMCTPAVPQQDNNSDCGVYLLHYAEMMFRNPIRNYCLPIKSLQTWFKPEDAKKKRSIIKDVIEQLRVLQSS